LRDVDSPAFLPDPSGSPGCGPASGGADREGRKRASLQLPILAAAAGAMLGQAQDLPQTKRDERLDVVPELML